MEFSSSLVFLAIPLGFVIGVVVGAFILQAACALCNIEDIRYVKALGLLMLLVVANAPIVALILFMGQGVVSGWGWGKTQFWLCSYSSVVRCIGFCPVSFSFGLCM
jgi:hypothetical protein